MNSLKRNFFYSAAYQLLIILLPILTIPYISRILGPTNVGIYSYANAIASYFMMFIILGLNNYGNRTVAAVRDNKQKLSAYFVEIYGMQLLSSFIICSIYIGYILLFHNDVIMWIMFFAVISSAFDINWFFFGLELFKVTVIRNIIIKIGATILIFLCVRTSADLPIYVFIMTASVLLSQIILWTFLPKYIEKPNVIHIKNILRHFKPNLILFIPVVAASLYKIFSKIILGQMGDMTQVGYYDSIEKILNIPIVLISALGIVMLPRITHLFANKKGNKAKDYFDKSIIVSLFLASSLGFGVMAVAEEFVPWFFGSQYMPCIILAYILMPSCIFTAFANVVRTQYLIPKAKDRVYIVSILLGAIFNLSINFLTIPSFGAIGVSFGTLVAEAVVCIYQAICIRKELDLSNAIKYTGYFVLSGIVMVGVVHIIPIYADTIFMRLIEKIVVGIVVYGIMMIPLGLFYIKKRRHQNAG